jgi:nucleotide-binding universal stress UspA family protein
MFTRLLVGVDGSPQADAALEQAVALGRRFHSHLVVATVAEGSDAAGEADVLLERARFRVVAAGLAGEAVRREGQADLELADLAREADAALVGRRGVRGERAGPKAIGRTVAALVRIAERCVIVCGGALSPMRACAVAFDGRNHRALELAARFASGAGSTVHVIHACGDRAEGAQVLGQAEALLSLLGVEFQTHLEEGSAGEVVARVVRAIRADALFAGAHVPRGPGDRRPSVASHTEDILLHTDLPVAIQP